MRFRTWFPRCCVWSSADGNKSLARTTPAGSALIQLIYYLSRGTSPQFSTAMAEREFQTPLVHLNYDTWGPTTLPEQFVDVPYAPFGKGDRLGKASDFTSSHQFGRYRNYQQRGRGEQDVNLELQYRFDVAEDSAFHLVDTSKSHKPRIVGRRPWQQRGRRDQFQGRNRRLQANQAGQKQGHPQRGGPQSKFDKNQKRGRFGGRGRRDDRKVDRAASVKVQATWHELDQFELPQLLKLQANVPDVEDLKWCGFLESYDDSYDRLSARTEKPLERVENKDFYYVTTTDDPVIEELATEGAGNVFATDAILAHLMSSPRSVYPWDIVVQRVGKTLFFDKRDNSQFDLLTVNETATEPPATDDADSINHPDKLSVEATAINQNFSQQILLSESEKLTYDNPNPFYDEESEDIEPAAVAYRYRKFDLGNGINLVARCELHGRMQKRGVENLITAYAVNEWDSKVSGTDDWRKKIDSQRGAVIATELKNNSNKLGKWTAQSILSDADQMLIGFVSRKSPTDAFNHSVIGTQFYKPRDFAQQINMNLNNMWGIIKMLCDKFMQMDEGKYVIMRDPNRPVVRIYSVPPNTFDDEESEDDDEEDAE